MLYLVNAIWVNKVFQISETLVKGISKVDLHYLLNLAIKESFFRFNSKFYIQVGGAVIRSLLGQILDNIFFHTIKKTE